MVRIKIVLQNMNDSRTRFGYLYFYYAVATGMISCPIQFMFEIRLRNVNMFSLLNRFPPLFAERFSVAATVLSRKGIIVVDCILLRLFFSFYFDSLPPVNVGYCNLYLHRQAAFVLLQHSANRKILFCVCLSCLVTFFPCDVGDA